MDIRKRINARKIVLSYFYQHCFFSLMSKKDSTDTSSELKHLDEIEYSEQDKKFLSEDFIKEVHKKREKDLNLDKEVQDIINSYSLTENIEEDFPYFLKYFFDQWTSEEVEAEYVLKIWASLRKYEKSTIEKIDKHTTTFWYDKMDPLDQSLLLLWYIEYKVFWTPKELIINEMVELAKRYGDDWSPKLINWILHWLITEEEKKE